MMSCSGFSFFVLEGSRTAKIISIVISVILQEMQQSHPSGRPSHVPSRPTSEASKVDESIKHVSSNEYVKATVQWTRRSRMGPSTSQETKPRNQDEELEPQRQVCVPFTCKVCRLIDVVYRRCTPA